MAAEMAMLARPLLLCSASMPPPPQNIDGTLHLVGQRGAHRTQGFRRENHRRDQQAASLNFSQFVARQYRRKRRATRYRCRAHGVQNGAFSSSAYQALWINRNHLQILRN